MIDTFRDFGNFTRLTFLAAFAFVTISVSASGAAYIYHYEVTGTCEELTYGNANLTHVCEDNILYIGYDDGRTDINVFAGDMIIVFSSQSERDVGDQVERNIDRMSLGHRGDDLVTVIGRGTCLLASPFDGDPARFECTARLKGDDPIHLIFMSDGVMPTDIAQ